MIEVIIHCTVAMFMSGNNTVNITTDCVKTWVDTNTISIYSCDGKEEIIVPANLCSIVRRTIK